MGEFREEDHPRDGGKFTATGGGPHVANTEHAAAGKAEHEQAAEKHKGAAKARRSAAAKTGDPVARSEHLARAAHHEARAAEHERAAGHGHEKSGLAKWASEKLDKLKEHVKEAGEKAVKVEDATLAKGGIEKGAIEAAKAVAGGATSAALKAVPGGHHEHAEHGHKE